MLIKVALMELKIGVCEYKKYERSIYVLRAYNKEKENTWHSIYVVNI